MPRTMPVQKPGKSETIVRTPPEFLAAVKGLLGIKRFDIDLAACADNAVSGQFFTKDDNALTKPWLFDGWCWCNPPYDNIRPWVAKARNAWIDFGTQTAVLVPASVGSNWWDDFVHEQADVRFPKGRLTFLYADGTRHKSCYPKDLALILYGNEPGYDVWDWRKQST